MDLSSCTAVLHRSRQSSVLCVLLLVMEMRKQGSKDVPAGAGVCMCVCVYAELFIKDQGHCHKKKKNLVPMQHSPGIMNKSRNNITEFGKKTNKQNK